MLGSGEIELILDDLLDKRHDDLVKSKAGKFYEPELTELRDELQGIPSELRGTPLTEELQAADERHDGYGGVIYFVTEAALRDPDASPKLAAAAKRIRAAFIPELIELQSSYVDEAKRARHRKPQLDDTAMKADLQSIPVAEHGSLFEVASKFVDAGEKLHILLSDRGDAIKPDRRALITVRPRAIGVLNELRGKLKKEVAKDSSLPRDLEQRVFGYFDTVLSMRKSGAKAAPQVPPEAEPPAGTPK